MGLKPMLIFVMDEGHAAQLPSMPGFGAGISGGVPVDPGYGVPAPGHPSHGLPGGMPHPGHGLPPVPPSVPVTKPSPTPPGGVARPLPALPEGSFILVWAPGHGWVGVALDPNAPGVDNTLPSTPPGHVSGQPVPPGHVSGQPVPPGVAPTPTPQGRR